MTYANSYSTPKQSFSHFHAFESTHRLSFKLWWVFCFVVLAAGGVTLFPPKASAISCTVGLPCTISVSIDAQDPEADPIYGIFSASPSSYTISSCSPVGGSNTGSQCTTGQLPNGSGTLSSTYQFSEAISYNANYQVCDNAQHCSSGSVPVDVVPDATPPSISFLPTSRAWGTADISVTPTASDASGISYVRHCWTTSTSCDPGTASASTFTNGTAVTQTADGVWYLCVKAQDTVGNWNASPVCASTYSKDATAPTKVNLTLIGSPTKTSLTLSWSAATDSGSGLNHYELWRAPDSGGVPGAWVMINGSVASPAADTPTEGQWWYGIHAVDNVGNYSTENAPQSGVKDVTAPTPNPATGSTSSVTSTSITWNINTPTDNLSGLAPSPYSFDNGSTWQPSGSLTDNGLACGTNYSKLITTRDAAGNTTSTGTLSATTSICAPGILLFTSKPANPTSSTSATFIWNSVTGASSYDLYWEGAYLTSQGTTSKALSGLSAVSHSFSAIPVNVSGQGTGDSWTWLIDTTAPAVVTGLSLSASVTNIPVSLSWNASTDGQSGLALYELWRAPDSGGVPGAWAKVKDVGLSINTTDVPPTSGIYWYGIHAVDNVGNYSTETGPVKVTYDTVTPTLSNPSPVTAVSLLRPNLSATVSDNLSGLSSTTVTVSRAGTPVLQKSFGAVTSLLISTGDWSAPLTNATYTVRVVAIDQAGNQLDTSGWTFVISNLAPNKPNLR